MKVIAKTAITTVESNDCSEVSQDSLSAAAAEDTGSGVAGDAVCSWCCSGAGSGEGFNRQSLERCGVCADAPALASLPVVQPAFSSNETRAQHNQDFHVPAAACAPPPGTGCDRLRPQHR